MRSGDLLLKGIREMDQRIEPISRNDNNNNNINTLHIRPTPLKVSSNQHGSKNGNNADHYLWGAGKLLKVRFPASVCDFHAWMDLQAITGLLLLSLLQLVLTYPIAMQASVPYFA